MANTEDPMITTKTFCTSCNKSVPNLQGYRAQHVNWDNFPFKDPGKRMIKSGMGFNNMFNQAQMSNLVNSK